ncbi:MAG TPA: alanine racemase [Gemmatimonas sp.]|uniref:alanine racemase n=1 Tax=Gemmatimonas sp. TaxID=1962908 RepID=UPI002EDA73B1
MTRQDRAWLDVDGSALRHNLSVLQRHARVPLLPMVKADSYGLGAIGVCRALGVPFEGDTPTVRPEVEAPWGVGIASLDEAESLRAAGCAGRILCATPLLARELPRAHSLSVRPALHRAEDIAAWRSLSDAGTAAAPYHLSIDTGMARAGARWDTVAALREAIQAVPPEGVFTHFHSADESLPSRDQQDERFDGALALLRDVLPAQVIEHRDNSGGIVSRTVGSPGHLARPGIALYAGMFTAELGLRQVAHLRARVIDVRDVQPGESVSYGATWTAPGTHRVATLSAGYADGYRRHLSNVGEVLIHGTRCPVVGRVTMDMTMVDVTGLGCEPGDVATMVGGDGEQMLTAESVAERAGVSPYELLVGLRMRVPAIHHDVLDSSSRGTS